MAADAQVFKVVLLGDSCVGKSSTLQRFAQNTFVNTYLTTIGVDFQQRDLNINGTLVRLQIFDTAGQERFDTISRAYYRGAEGLLIFYDITNQESYLHIRKWIKNSENEAGSAIKFLVGNKSDLDKERVVSKEDGKKLATEIGCECMETSALTGANVDEVFIQLAKQILASTPQRVRKNTIHLSRSPSSSKKSKSKCC